LGQQNFRLAVAGHIGQIERRQPGLAHQARPGGEAGQQPKLPVFSLQEDLRRIEVAEDYQVVAAVLVDVGQAQAAGVLLEIRHRPAPQLTVHRRINQADMYTRRGAAALVRVVILILVITIVGALLVGGDRAKRDRQVRPLVRWTQPAGGDSQRRARRRQRLWEGQAAVLEARHAQGPLLGTDADQFGLPVAVQVGNQQVSRLGQARKGLAGAEAVGQAGEEKELGRVRIGRNTVHQPVVCHVTQGEGYAARLDGYGVGVELLRPIQLDHAVSARLPDVLGQAPRGGLDGEEVIAAGHGHEGGAAQAWDLDALQCAECAVRALQVDVHGVLDVIDDDGQIVAPVAIDVGGQHEHGISNAVHEAQRLREAAAGLLVVDLQDLASQQGNVGETVAVEVAYAEEAGARLALRGAQSAGRAEAAVRLTGQNDDFARLAEEDQVRPAIAGQLRDTHGGDLVGHRQALVVHVAAVG
jgi:hypothetical protein